MSKRLIALLAAVLAIAAIAGCGGGDSDTETAAPESTPSASEGSGGPALTKAEFIEQGDAICKENQEEGEAELGAVIEEIGSEPSEEDQERVVTEVVVPTLQASADGLRGLTPPEGEEDAVAEIVDGFDAAIASIEEDPVAALEGDPFADVNEKAIAFGLEVCGEN